MELSSIIALGVLGFLGLFSIGFARYLMSLRRVVSTDEVHIVQSAGKTTSYGMTTGNGNVYYEWPSHWPILGMTKVILPVSNFTILLDNYEAYDEGRLPFVVDIMATFQIADSNEAAKRVASFEELKNQLRFVVQGAVRTILASNKIEEILQGRSKFGDQFTKEIEGQLPSWGVRTVKNLELMDIRDSSQGAVIKNIMEKKKSLIEMESRTEVAKNKKTASIAEIEAQKEVDLQKQDALQAVGLRTTQQKREVALADQEALQAQKEQERLTKEKEMAITKVQELRTAEIAKEVEIVKAEQEKQVSIVKAEGQKQNTVLTAEGNLEATKRNAEGITLEGTAKAEAEKAFLLAPVDAQIKLAKEIGSNDSYQKYLVTLEQVKAQQAVGIANASALEKAEIKVIANTGTNVQNGMTNVLDLFSSTGGTAVGAMLDGLSNTEGGKALVDKVLSVGGGKNLPAPTKEATKK